jgi:iron(III) transport system substrate-binding protein
MRLRLLLQLGLMVAAGAALAQTPAVEGPQRLEAARREGALMLYTSMAQNDSAPLIAAFEKRYGLKVNLWRSGKANVLQRVITEAQAGRFNVDLVQNPSPEMEALHQQKLLQPVRSPVQDELIPAALPAHREWAGMRVYVFVQSFNTRKVARSELPQRFEDLLNPRWKGRLGIEVKQQEWFYTLVQAMGEDKGLAFFRSLLETNQPSLRTGASLLENMVASGEVDMAINMYSHRADQAKAEGAPVDSIVLAPTVAYTDAIGIARRAPHPNAARLFYDFLLSDGQKIAAENHAMTTGRSDAARLAALHPVYIDPVKVLESYDKWGAIYRDLLNRRAAAR